MLKIAICFFNFLVIKKNNKMMEVLEYIKQIEYEWKI